MDGLITSKDDNRGMMEGDSRGLVKGIQARPGVPDNLKSQLRITVPSGPGGRTMPIMPDNLVAVGQQANIMWSSGTR